MDLAIGSLALLFGLYTLYLRLTGKIETFAKLEPMKNLFGSKLGGFVHLIAYTILPLILGLVLLLPLISRQA